MIHELTKICVSAITAVNNLVKIYASLFKGTLTLRLKFLFCTSFGKFWNGKMIIREESLF